MAAVGLATGPEQADSNRADATAMHKEGATLAVISGRREVGVRSMED
jgi:hypothetical protein